MVLKSELKKCADLARTTYLDMMKTKLHDIITSRAFCEVFPNPAREKYMNKMSY